MNITILKNALEKYLCATENNDEKLLCAKALEELTCVMDRYENADCWDNDAVLLPADSWVDILDAMTYDILGERLRMHGDNMHPEYYYYDVRKQCAGLEQIASLYLAYGYEVLSDRWMNNEANDCHDASGHFKSNSLTGDKATHAWRLIAAQDPEILADICGISTEEAEALIKEAQE